MARDMLTFLDKYFELFPEQLDRELYIAGESFAGQYIPYISKAILDRNKELSLHDKQYLNLQGLLIGNGWIDPVNQYLTYLQFSYSTGLIEQGSKAANVIEQMHNACADALSELANMTVHVDKCEKMTNEIFSQWHQNTRLNVNDPKSCVNMYNINLTDTYPSCGMNWPPDLDYMYPYLQRPEVRSALHTAKDSSAWEECRGKPGKEFNTEHSVASVSLLPELLDQIPIWFFNGDQDFICNRLGNERMIDQLEWNGYKGFNEIDEVEEAWIYDGTMAGTVTSGRNLTYVKFFEASHMVPFDFPERTQFMLNVFTGLTDWKLNNRVAKPDPGLQHEGEDEDRDKLINDAKWHAYYRAGEVALVFVVIATIGFGYFLYRNNVEILSDGNETHSWLRSFVRGLSRWKPNSHLTRNRYRYSGLSNSSPLTGRRTFTDAEVILEASEEGEDEDDNRRPQDEENGYHNNESTNRELEEFVVHKP
jgi:carboxypeptidase D